MNPARSGNGPILVIEDDVDIRESLVELLCFEGYSAVGAANGAEALAALHADPVPCLIILDLMMPGMNGWEFRRRQQQDPALAGVPVFVVTGDDHAGPGSRDLAADAYFIKPIDLDSLLARVADFCRCGAPGAEAEG